MVTLQTKAQWTPVSLNMETQMGTQSDGTLVSSTTRVPSQGSLCVTVPHRGGDKGTHDGLRVWAGT